MDNVAGTTCVACGGKQPTFSLQEGFAHIQALTQQNGKATNSYQKAFAEGVEWETPEGEGSTVPAPKDGTGIQSIAKVFDSKTEPDETKTYGTTLRPRRTSRTIPSVSAKVEREALWSGN